MRGRECGAALESGAPKRIAISISFLIFRGRHKLIWPDMQAGGEISLAQSNRFARSISHFIKLSSISNLPLESRRESAYSSGRPTIEFALDSRS